MAGFGDYVQGPDGNWYDPADVPPGSTTINQTQYGEPPPGAQAQPAINRGSLINTPDSSRGTPFRLDPSASSLDLQLQGRPGTLTASSTTGAPAPGIRNLPATQNLGNGQDYVTNLIKNYGAGYVRRYLPQVAERAMLPIAVVSQLVQPSDELASPRQDEAPTNMWNQRPSGVGGMPGPQAVTQTGTQPMIPPRTPTPTMTGGPIGPGPEGRGPGLPMGPLAAVPPNSPTMPTTQNTPTPPVRPNAGQGGGRGGGARPAPPITNLQPTAPQPGWTTIDRPNADVVGGRSVGGQLAPQYFNPSREPGGPAQMGAFDFSSLFNHPAVANAAAAHPAVQAAARAQVRGPLAQGALGRPQNQQQQQGRQPGPMDPTILAGGPGAPMRQPGPVDPTIIARRAALYAGQNPGDVGGYGAGT